VGGVPLGKHSNGVGTIAVDSQSAIPQSQFAIVAAKREIKTEWMYRIVRHPIYASYILTFGCYVLVHTTLANLLVYAMLGDSLYTNHP